MFVDEDFVIYVAWGGLVDEDFVIYGAGGGLVDSGPSQGPSKGLLGDLHHGPGWGGEEVLAPPLGPAVREVSKKAKILSERVQQKLGFLARGVNKSEDSEQEGSTKVKILSERGLSGLSGVERELSEETLR